MPSNSGMRRLPRPMRPAARLRRAARDALHAMMFGCAYRNFGTHESLVTNHTVDAGGQEQAAIRWYEIRNPAARPAGAALVDLPAEHVRARRRQPPLDGLDRPGPQRQHGPRLQHLLQTMFPSIAHNGPAGRRPARTRWAPRTSGSPAPAARRTPSAGGATTARCRRPRRRLHVLVHAAVLPGDGQLRLEHPHGVLQVPGLQHRPARHDRRDRDRRHQPDRGSDRHRGSVEHLDQRGG